MHALEKDGIGLASHDWESAFKPREDILELMPLDMCMNAVALTTKAQPSGVAVAVSSVNKVTAIGSPAK